MTPASSESVGPELFIRTIFRDALTPERRVVISAFGTEGCLAVKWCGSAEEAAGAVEAFDTRGNTYMSCGLLDAAAEAPGKRGAAKDVVAIGAVWADVDVGEEGHKGKCYPPTLELAVDHLRLRIEQPPSITLETGGGAHLWWLLDEPWIFENDADRAEGAALVERWQMRIRAAWSEKGWDLDATHDLARVLRVPDTYNHKFKLPRPVSVLGWNVR